MTAPETQRHIDERFMREALAEARAAEALGEVPIGAVVVRDGAIVARAHNRRELDHDPSAHAEFSALTAAARELGRWRLPDCTVYVTLEPCTMCAGLMVNARVGRCVYGAADAKAGALGSLYRLNGDHRLNHAFPVEAGVLADECSELLRGFFAVRRMGRAAGLAADDAHEAALAQATGVLETPISAATDAAVHHQLNVLLAVDSFKGCASSAQVEGWIAEGIRRVVPNADLTCIPVADGGEGTVDAVAAACGAEPRAVEVAGPLGRAVRARYVLVGETAVLEMASAAGLHLSDRSDAAATAASTRGVGELVLAAVRDGARRVLVGLGGSCTNDGGAGFLQALGARLLDADGAPIAPGLAGLAALASIDLGPAAAALAGVELVALSDVGNPLLGARGALAIFGPQKGLADPSAHHAAMARYAVLLDKARERAGIAPAGRAFRSVAGVPGAGAAGGLGAAMLSVGAELTGGVDAILDLTGIDAVLAGADLVVTGEGHMDAQSAEGKAPVGVAARAKRARKPVVAIVGGRADDLDAVYAKGIDLVIPVLREPMDLARALAPEEARANLVCAGEAAARAFLLGR